MNLLVKELIKPLLEESQKIIGFFGGGFKPVTKGHFDVVKKALEDNPDIDEFIIYVGKATRDNIDQSQSLLMWDIYSKYLPMKVKIEPVSSPVKAILDYIKEHPQERIYWFLGTRDETDYTDIEQRTKNVKQNPNVEIKSISGLNIEISGTKARKAILNNNKQEFFNHIPNELDLKDKEKVWDIIKPTIDENLIEAKQAGILYHYTLLDYLASIIDDNALKALGTTTFGPIISFTRDKNFHKVKRDIMGTECRIVIDGDKLSNNYKITPIAEKDFKRNTNNTESEERITFVSRNDEIKNLNKYVISYDIFLDKILDDEDAISMLLYLRKDFAKKGIINVNYYMNNKLLSNDEVEKLINDKSSSANIVESKLNDNGDYKKFLLYLDKLLNYCCEDLQIKKPKVIIINDDKYTQENHSFGGYMPGGDKIYLVIKNRNLSDCARSLSHELRHHWQYLNNMIKPGDGKDGDEIENDANAYAGKIMRKFGRENPEIFTLVMTENLNKMEK